MVLNKRIQRALLENKTQYVGSVILIILSCLLFVVMTLVSTNLERLTSDFANRTVQEDASFSTKHPISNIQEIGLSTDAVIEEGRTFDYTIKEGITLRIFSQNGQMNLPAIIDGKELKGSGEILLNPIFAEAHRYKIGDVMTISDKQFKVAGYMALPNYIYPLKTETDLMYSPQNFGIAVISREDFSLFGDGSSYYMVKYNHLKENPRIQSAELRAKLRKSGIDILQWTDKVDNKRISSVTLKIQTMNLMSKIVPGALLLLTSILIGNVIGRLIKSEAAVIGALYAFGYRRKELYRHYLIFPITIAIIGGIIGAALGLLVVRPLLLFMLTAFTIPLTWIDFNPLIIFLSVLLPVLFLGCSSYFVIRKELKRPPVELIKGNREKSKVNFLERTLKLDKLKFTAKYQIREQLRSLSRLAFLLVGCVFATMLLLYGFTIKSSLDYFSTNSLTETFHFQNEYVYNSLRLEQPPAGSEPFSASLFLQEDGEGRDFYVCGVERNSTMFTIVDEAGASLRMNHISITKPLADKLKVKQGDTVNIVRKLDERVYSVKIDSIADTYVGKYIFMPLDVYNKMFGLPEGSYSGLWSKEKLDIPQDQLYSKKSIAESLTAIKETTVPIQYMVLTYSVMAFIMGLVIIYLVTSMIVEENKRNISLLKIFGYRKKEVNALVLNSSTLVVVIGYILGIPMILATIGGLLQSLDNSVGLTLPIRINPLYILIGFVVVMFSYELSKLMSRKKVNAVSMSEALKSGME